MQRGSMTSHEWATVKIESLKLDKHKFAWHATFYTKTNQRISSTASDENLEVKKNSDGKSIQAGINMFLGKGLVNSFGLGRPIFLYFF